MKNAIFSKIKTNRETIPLDFAKHRNILRQKRKRFANNIRTLNH